MLYVTAEQLVQRLRTRPKSYWDELADALVKETTTGFVFDTEHEAWKRLVAKYKNKTKCLDCTTMTNCEQWKKFPCGTFKLCPLGKELGI